MSFAIAEISPILLLLKERIGLNHESIGVRSIENAAYHRMRTCGLPNLGAYYFRLLESPDEFKELVELIVVPESWFFRDNHPFVALSRHIARNWLGAHTDRKLRILSVPCSTGQEPYSIAMVLLDIGMNTSRFSIDAVDISEKALEAARRAVYNDYAFRGDVAAYQNKYFIESEDGYALLDVVRQAVNFRQGNLLDMSFLRPGERYDFIFCRNVMIYMDNSTKDEIITKLSAHLEPQGYLFVGHAESARMTHLGFRPMAYPMAFAFTPSGRAQADVSGARLKGQSLASRLPTRRAVAQPRPTAQKQISPGHPPELRLLDVRATELEEGRESLLVTARNLADAGRLGDAAALCEKYVLSNPECPQGHHLLGCISMAMNELLQAEEHLQKAVYLNPEFHEALVLLANLMERRGDIEKSRQMNRRAARIRAEREAG